MAIPVQSIRCENMDEDERQKFISGFEQCGWTFQGIVNFPPPHLFLNFVWDKDSEPQYPSWYKGRKHCLELLSRCDELWLCGGWRDSRGCCMEYAAALMRHMPVCELNRDLNPFPINGEMVEAQNEANL